MKNMIKAERNIITFDVTEKKIKIPKSLRSEIKSYRRIGHGANERDVLVGEIVQGKYLVFPLLKEIDLDNSKIYIVERVPGSTSEEDKEEPTPVKKEDKHPEEEGVLFSTHDDVTIRYKVKAYRKLMELPDGSHFIYDDMVWTVRVNERRVVISAHDMVSRFGNYMKNKLKSSNPYAKINNMLVKEVSIV